MRPTDALHNPPVEMPTWMRTLQRALGDNGPRPANGTLTPLVALEELSRLDSDSLPESSEDRNSQRNDLKRALEELGDETTTELATPLSDFRANTLGRLPELLSSAGGLTVALAAAAVLQGRLTSPRTVASAWRDTLTAFRGNADYETCALRLAQLREVVEARGHEWIVERELLVKILNDGAEAAAVAGAELAPPANGRRYEWDELAGLDDRSRLDLIERHLARSVDEELAVVWLRFLRASLEAGEVEAGSARYIDTAMLREGEDADIVLPQDTEVPPEVAERHAERFGLPAQDAEYVVSLLLFELGDDDPAVLARVETNTSQGRAVTTARQRVRDQIDAAILGHHGQGWALQDGYVVITASGLGWVGFHEAKWAPAGFHPYLQDSGRALGRLDKRLIAALDEGRTDAIEAVELARWEQGLRDAPDDAFRVGLGVRNLERALPDDRVPRGGGGAHWAKVASYYLRDTWRWKALMQEIDDAREYAATPPYEASGLDPDDHKRFFADVERITGTGGHPQSRASLVRHAMAIAELNGLGSSRRRILEKTASDTATPEAALARLRQLGSDFDALLARAARQRNASVHGAKAAPQLLSNVLPFVSGVSIRIAEAALAAAAEGRPLVVRLEQERLSAIERLTSLEAGVPLAQLVASS
jgi:hypothetical protein